ncbi:MAG: Rieske 2Fe-2S domain-containing protein, partial [Myxococcota bacterium]|nr:Rieske 2Fe-2S domain-containing protein [Myxococcota bacterium]
GSSSCRGRRAEATRGPRFTRTGYPHPMLTPQIAMEAFSDLPFPVATRAELRKKGKLQIEAMGRKLCVLWNNGDPRVFADSCAHLGLPLSLGRLRGDRLRCAYHGWTYDTDSGEVVEQPTLRSPQPCKLKRFGCLVAGGLVFAWLGDPTAVDAARGMLPEEVIDDFSHFRVVFDCPFYLALFSSVDYAHFAYHTGYRSFYKIYSSFRSNEHQPGTVFPTEIAEETDRRVTLRIPDADRDIHMYATCTEMDDKGVNFFQTYVTPISPMKTLYWECYRPRSESLITRILARSAFRTVTTRLLNGEDRLWTGAAAPHFVAGENIHLCENDLPLGTHLRKFVTPRMKAWESQPERGEAKS